MNPCPRFLATLGFILLVVVHPLRAQQSSAVDTLVITDVNVVDVRTGEIRPDQVVIIDGNRITADYNIRLQATGVYNLAFSMWGLSNLPPSPANIHCEVMIWIANSELKPAGTRRGTIEVQGTRYGVYINEHQRDKSGLLNRDWIYVAYVAHRPVLNGPLDVNAFIEDLRQRKILTPDLWLTDFELGNEVSQGTGITEIQDFVLHLD